MPRIRLEFPSSKKLVLSDGVNPPLTLDQTRLEVRVQLPGSIIRTAIIDTGAPFTIMSKSLWSLSEILDQIEWLLFRPGEMSTLSLPDLRVGGKQYLYRVGCISLTPCDVNGSSLPAIATTCKFLEDDPQSPLSPQFIIGLTKSLINDRYLIVKPSTISGLEQAWITDESIDWTT
jgi:hypothetical protein